MTNINSFFENANLDFQSFINKADEIGDAAVLNFTEDEKRIAIEWCKQI